MRVDRWASTESDDMLDRTEANEAHEPIEKAEHAEPRDPIERNEPTEPMENDEPTEAIEQNESLDHSDHPVLRMGPAYGRAAGPVFGHTWLKQSAELPRMAR